MKEMSRHSYIVSGAAFVGLALGLFAYNVGVSFYHASGIGFFAALGITMLRLA